MKIRDKTLFWLIEQDEPDFYRVDVASYLISGEKYAETIASSAQETVPFSEEEIEILEKGGFNISEDSIHKEGWLIYKIINGRSVFVPPEIELTIKSMDLDAAKSYLETQVQKFESEINRGVTSETLFEKLKYGLVNLKNTRNSLDIK